MLNETQMVIAKLAFSTVKKPLVKDNRHLNPILFIATIVTYFLGLSTLHQYGFGGLVANYCSNIFFTQSIFAELDRKKKSVKPSYISSVNPATQSGWANNPRVLQHIPQFLSTRVLTSFTLIEVGALLAVAFLYPEYTPHTMIFTVFGHYITDALDGAVGRYRKEGYVLWGYYVDHCFDTIYEVGCMLALWIVTKEIPEFGIVCTLTMSLTVYLFHRKELFMFNKKLATQYSNVLGSFPLHYIEWGSVVILWVIVFTGTPLTSVVPYVAMIVMFSCSNLVWWFIKQIPENPYTKL